MKRIDKKTGISSSPYCTVGLSRFEITEKVGAKLFEQNDDIGDYALFREHRVSLIETKNTRTGSAVPRV